MPTSRPLRSGTVALLAVVALVMPGSAQARFAAVESEKALSPPATTAVAVAVTSTTRTTHTFPPAKPATIDPRLTRTECSLLGRRVVASGCSTRQCARASDTIKPARNAEVCYLDGRRTAAYGADVPATACRLLGRVWVDEVNLCASNPRRDIRVLHDTPLCAEAGQTYVDHTESEGAWDECLSAHQLRVFTGVARRTGESVNRVADRLSQPLCALRPNTELTATGCRARTTPAGRAPRGTLVIGDSITWRGEDELQALHPDWTVDGKPGRIDAELTDRVRDYLGDHAAPQVLVIALGANPGPHPSSDNYTRAIALLPDTTRLILVTPYRQRRPTDEARRQIIVATAHGMQLLAELRPYTCVADWAAYAADHPRELIDDVHPTSHGESRWAEFISSSWRACRA